MKWLIRVVLRRVFGLEVRAAQISLDCGTGEGGRMTPSDLWRLSEEIDREFGPTEFGRSIREVLQKAQRVASLELENEILRKRYQ